MAEQSTGEAGYFAQLFDQADLGIAAVGADGESLAFVNPAFARMHGYTQKQLTGKPANFVFESAACAALGAAGSAGPLVRNRFDSVNVRRDGSAFPVHIDVTAVKDGQDQVAFRVAFVWDISERVSAQLAQRESQARFSEIFQSDLYTVMFSEVGTWRIVDVNPAWLKLYGYSKREALELTVPDISAEPERTRASLAETVSNGRVDVVVRWHLRRDGTKFPVELVGTAFRVNGQHLVCTTIRDITKRVEAERALRSSEEYFRKLFSSDLAAFTILDFETGRVVKANPAAARLYGYSLDEVQAMGALDVTTDPQATLAALQQAASMGQLHVPLRWHRRKDGTVFPVEIYISNFVTDDGRYICVTTRDITERVAAERQLANQVRFIGQLIETMPSPVFYKDEGGRFLGCNTAFERFNGIAREDLIGRTASDLWPRELADIYTAADQALFAAPGTQTSEAAAVDAEGTRREVIAYKATFTKADGGVGGLVGILLDVTEQRRIDASLRRANRALQVIRTVNRALARSFDEGDLLESVCRVLLDPGGYRMAWIGFVERDAARSIRPMAHGGIDSGYLDRAAITWGDTAHGQGPTGNAVRTGAAQICRDIAADPVMQTWREDALQRGFAACVSLPLRSGAEVFGVLVIYAAEAGAFDDEEVRLLEELSEDLAFGIVAGRTRIERQRAEDRAERLVNFDPLTELPNRLHLQRYLEPAMQGPRGTGAPLALLRVSLDHYSELEDGIGTAGAGELLKEFARRIAAATRNEHFLAYVGSESFALALPGCDAAGADALALALHPVLDEPFEYRGVPIDIQATMGICLFPQDGASADELIRRSAIAVRQARAAGLGHARYSGRSDAESPRRLTLLAELRKAIRTGGLELHYQPKIDFASGRVCGVEALLRWAHARHGMVPPGDFIPMAEDTGLIKPITYWVLEAAMHQLAHWHLEGLDVPVAVNVSANSLRDPDFLAQLLQLRDRTGARLELLQIELTETALMADPEHARLLLARIRELGVKVFIDDFGTGYSSLSYIATLPIHALKIDKSFVNDMLLQPRQHAVVAATISLAHALRLRVVGEGIETREQADALAGMGCDEVQGFHFARPMPAEELLRWYGAYRTTGYTPASGDIQGVLL